MNTILALQDLDPQTVLEIRDHCRPDIPLFEASIDLMCGIAVDLQNPDLNAIADRLLSAIDCYGLDWREALTLAVAAAMVARANLDAVKVADPQSYLWREWCRAMDATIDRVMNARLAAWKREAAKTRTPFDADLERHLEANRRRSDNE